MTLCGIGYNFQPKATARQMRWISKLCMILRIDNLYETYNLSKGAAGRLIRQLEADKLGRGKRV